MQYAYGFSAPPVSLDDVLNSLYCLSLRGPGALLLRRQFIYFLLNVV